MSPSGLSPNTATFCLSDGSDCVGSELQESRNFFFWEGRPETRRFEFVGPQGLLRRGYDGGALRTAIFDEGGGFKPEVLPSQILDCLGVMGMAVRDIAANTSAIYTSVVQARRNLS